MKTSRKLLFTVVALSLAVVPLLGTGAALASHNGASSLSASIRLAVFGDKTLYPFLYKIFTHMHRSYPKIKVKIEPWQSTDRVKMVTEIATGTGPDVVQVGDIDLPFFVSKNAFASLDPYMKRDHISKDLYYPTLYKLGVVDGKLYALTKDYATLAIFYNKDLFKAAHVPFPKAGWTWNDFVQDARKLTVVKGGRPVQWGFTLAGGFSDWTRGIEPLVRDFGGRLASPDGKKIDGYMNSPQTVKAVQFYVDLYNKFHLAPTPGQRKAFQNLDLFSSGKVAMDWDGPWEITTWLQNKNFHFGVAPMPSYNGKAYSNVCWSGFAMNAHSNQKEAAWQVTKALGGPDGSRVFAQWGLPGVKSVATQLHVDKEPYRGLFIQEIKNVPGTPADMSNPDGGASVGDPFTQAIDHLLARPGSSVKAALDQAARTGQQELDNFMSGQ